MRFCLLIAVFLSQLAVAADRRTYSMNVPAALARSISFDLQEGDFTLRGDPAVREVQMRVSIDRYWVFKLGEQDILKRLIKVSGEGSAELTIATDIPRSWTNWGRAQYPIDFEVIVPADVQLKIRDTSGTLNISGMNGAVEIDDDSGTVAVSRLASSLRITKKSGDIRVQQVAGEVHIASQSGQMHLSGLGALDIERSDGNLDVADVGATRIHSAGGNMRITGVKGDLEIDDEAGEIVVRDVAGRVSIRDTSGQIRTSRTGPVTITDSSGDVTVMQAPSARVSQKESGKVKVTAVAGEVSVPPGINLSRN